MRIIIAGGTGQVGTLLARAFVADGHEVVVLSRRPMHARWRVVEWDAHTVGSWVRELEGADVVIGLAGRNVNCRYTDANRADIMRSRVESTRVVGRAIAACEAPPRVWLQMSTATIYAHRFDAPNDERTGIIGGQEADAPASWRFSIDVATAWEAAARESKLGTTRLAILRAAMVMSPDAGGIFATLQRLASLGLGGPVDGGRQYVSWIHERDFVRAVYWMISHDDIAGVVNVAAPAPLPYADFMRALRRAVGMPIALPATRWMVALGAWAMRTEPELVLKSRRVVPTRLLDSGFEFEFPEWSDAAANLVWQRHLQRPQLLPLAHPD
jgi:uncharacterized protein